MAISKLKPLLTSCERPQPVEYLRYMYTQLHIYTQLGLFGNATILFIEVSLRLYTSSIALIVTDTPRPPEWTRSPH